MLPAKFDKLQAKYNFRWLLWKTQECDRSQPPARLDQNAATTAFEISLSGAQIVAGFASALSFVAIVLCADIKLWLFEQ